MPKDTTILAKIIAIDAEVSCTISSEQENISQLSLRAKNNLTALESTKRDISMSDSTIESQRFNLKPLIQEAKSIDKFFSKYGKSLSTFYLKISKHLEAIKTLQNNEKSSILDTAQSNGVNILKTIDEQIDSIEVIKAIITPQFSIISEIETIMLQQQFTDNIAKIDTSILKIKGNIHDSLRAMTNIPIELKKEERTLSSIRASIDEITHMIDTALTTSMQAKQASIDSAEKLPETDMTTKPHLKLEYSS